MDYDEGSVLTRYMWDNYAHLMTDLELLAARVALWREKARGKKLPASIEATSRSWGFDARQAIESALADGSDAYRQRVRDRLLRECAEVVVNRCPRCGRVVRTPKARQCFWCGHDWHET